MTMTAAMLLIGIGIAVLLFIVVQRLDRIIALQLQHQDLTKESLQRLGRTASLLEDLPYREELERKRSEKAAREAGREFDMDVAELKRRLGQEPHT